MFIEIRKYYLENKNRWYNKVGGKEHLEVKYIIVEMKKIIEALGRKVIKSKYRTRRQRNGK